MEREDWEEAGCCFRPSAETTEIPHGQKAGGIQSAIEEYDRLISRDAKEEAEQFLEAKLDEFEKIGDWGSQITILNEMMGFYRSVGKEEKGLASVERGFALVKEHEMADTVSGATTYVNGATTLKAFGKAGEAIPYYEQAFRTYEKYLAPEDYRFGGLFHNMALAYTDLDEFEKAEAYFHKAMEIMDALQPGSILEIAVTWVNLAVLYEKWDREDEIDECLAQAILGFRSPDVPRDGYYAFNCRKCAGTFGHFGYFRIQKELNEAANQIYGENR